MTEALVLFLTGFLSGVASTVTLALIARWSQRRARARAFGPLTKEHLL